MSETTMTTQEFDNQAVSVEPAVPSDAEGVFNVQRLTWLSTYPNTEAGITEEDIRVRVEGEHGELIPQKVERWRNGIEASGEKRAVFVVRDSEKVVGFVAPAIMDGQRRIGAIYVLPETQGKGVGSKLLQKAIEWHGRDEDIFLHVASYNHNAIDFYKKNGFEETGKDVTDDVAQLSGGKAIPEIEMILRAKQEQRPANISSELPEPLSTFSVDVPRNQYYDFELAPNSTYPLRGVTYPVDYGNIPGYTSEDGHELDFFIGSQPNGEMGFVVVYRGDDTPDEHKFYIGLTEQEVTEVLHQLKPVLVENKKIDNLHTLLSMIEQFKDKA